MTVDPWSSAEPYERFMGRWSRLLAAEAVRWIDAPPGLRWLDVGCGTGALSAAVLRLAEPGSLLGVDPAEAYVAAATAALGSRRAAFEVAGALALPLPDASVDQVVSGLVLNFVPDIDVALAEMARVTAPRGRVSAYVWDYADGMGMLRAFWDAAVAQDPSAAELDEGNHFPVCREGALERVFEASALRDVRSAGIEITMAFKDFDDYWSPFLGGQGPGAVYVGSLSEGDRGRLRDSLAARLPTGADGSITLRARAWIVSGSV